MGRWEASGRVASRRIGVVGGAAARRGGCFGSRLRVSGPPRRSLIQAHKNRRASGARVDERGRKERVDGRVSGVWEGNNGRRERQRGEERGLQQQRKPDTSLPCLCSTSGPDACSLRPGVHLSTARAHGRATEPAETLPSAAQSLGGRSHVTGLEGIGESATHRRRSSAGGDVAFRVSCSALLV